MLRFLANNIEQIDLATEHVSKGDANNARFGLMLLDNVVEITLHQIARDKGQHLKSYSYRDKPYEHAAALDAALGQHFDAKVRFAKKLGRLAEDASESILIFHAFRNEVYHIGVQHEAVLPTVARFYLKVACEFLASYSPPWFGYSPGMALPERARKFFGDQRFFVDGPGDYQKACLQLGGATTFDPMELAAALADHMDDVIEQQDIAIDMIATGGPHQHTRDEAVVETFAWKIAFSEEGKRFANDYGFPGGNMFTFVTWIGNNYPLPFRRDPIAAWKIRAARLRAERNPHTALKKYRDFMTQTADTRAALEEAHGQVEQYIDEQIERMRGR
jgi:hypothetical protein